MNKKFFALLLAALMILPAFASCSNSGSNTEDQAPAPAAESPDPSAADAETEPAEDVNSRLAEKDDLPEADFGGRDFIVFGSDEEGFGVYIYTEEMNGEGVNDAVYQRNLTVEERFNAKTVYSGVASYGTCSSQITAAVASGDSESFDLVQYHVVSSSGNAMKGEYLNWYDIPHVDFTRSWWSRSNIDDLTIAGRCYLAIGDFALSSVGRSYVMLYDKDEAKNYQLEPFYTVVKEGRWTIDALRNVCSVVYTDANGNGKEDEGDYFGLGTDSYSNLNTYLWACDNQIFSRDDTGELEFRYYSEHLVDVYDACWNLINQTPGVYKKGEHKAGMKLFAQNGTLTCNAYLDGTISFLADFEHEYGVIPYPKLNEAQAEYKTMVDGNHEAMSVIIAEPELEFVGIMCEALCAESYKQVMPAYFDVCLKQRYAQSPEDAEMMDLCVNARVFDLGYVYDNWKGVSFYFQDLLVDANHPDITSFYKKREKVANKYYSKVVELFENGN